MELITHFPVETGEIPVEEQSAQATLASSTVGGLEEVTVPLTLSQLVNTQGINFSLKYDPAKLKLKEITKGSATAQMTLVSNLAEAGNIPVVLAGSQGISGDNKEVVVLKFLAKETSGNTSAEVQLEKLFLDETSKPDVLSAVEIVEGNHVPSLGEMVPSSGTSRVGKSLSIATSYEDLDGASTIHEAYFVMMGETGFLMALFGYKPHSNQLSLSTGETAAPGPPVVLEAEYVQLDCSHTKVTLSDTSLVIEWAIIFKTSFIGPKLCDLAVVDDAGDSAFGQKGNWNITANHAPILSSIEDKEIKEGDRIEFAVTAQDEDNDGLKLDMESLPANAQWQLTVSEPGKLEGIFTWTPDHTQAGEYSVTFSVSDGELSDSETAVITVLNGNQPPVVTEVKVFPLIANSGERVFLGGKGSAGWGGGWL